MSNVLHSIMPKDTLPNALNSQIPSLRISFYRDGAIDYGSIAAMIDRLMGDGRPLVMLNHEDAQFALLSDDEIATLIRFVSNRLQRKIWFVPADRPCGTNRAVDFARYCRDYFADAMVVLPPENNHFNTVDTLVRHYSAIARELPVIIDGAAFRTNPNVGMEVIQRLHATDTNIIGIKDAIGGNWAREMCQLVSDKWSVLSSGSLRHHSELCQHGSKGHLSPLLILKPEVADSYWNAVCEGDSATAEKIIDTIDQPLHTKLEQLPGGSNAGIHACMEILGLSQRWQRNPAYSLSDEELDALRPLVEKLLG